MEIIILLLFAVVLLCCVCFNISILFALLIGYLLFSGLTLKRGYSFRQLVKMSVNGIISARNILITFVLIGVLTALWRAGGTIPAIVYYSSGLMKPELFVVITFLLNCLISVLTGTAFGTAATMGAVCMSVASSLSINPVLVGGAVLSGVYFGDRCSPVSTSALLVSELTETNLYDNIKNMIKTSAVPFVLTCIIYYLSGLFLPVTSAADNNVCDIFINEFSISILTVVPAIIVVLLAIARVNVKITMLASIAASVFVCVFCQGYDFTEVLRFSVFGYTADNEQLSVIINGGGIISMLRVALIVCISSAYSGIFKNTGFLTSVRNVIDGIRNKYTAFAVVLITSVIASVVACNQTLTIMLTEQLCCHTEENKSKLAVYLENSAVIIAPLVPWSIAGNVPLTSAGAPVLSIGCAVFLYILPLYSLMVSIYENNRHNNRIKDKFSDNSL